MGATVVGKPGVKPLLLGGEGAVVAVPIVAETLREAKNQWEVALAAGADLVEWRLDALEPQIDPSQVDEVATWGREAFGVPVLATIRTEAEGGNYRGSNEQYVSQVQRVASWADLVDVEVERDGVAELITSLSPNVPVVASFHEFERPAQPGHVERILARMVRSGAAVAKVAWMVRDERDLKIVSGAALWARESLPVPAVVIGMGEVGRSTRLGKFARASAFTFAVASKSSAPGQPTIEEIRSSLENRP